MFAILAAGNLLGAVILAPDRGGDFAMLYESTTRWLRGEPAYVSSQVTTNLNHPLIWLVLAPLTALPLRVAFAVWTAISLLALGGTVVFVRRTLVEPSLSGAETLTVLLALTGAGFELGLGQIAFALAVPFTAAWWYSRRGRRVPAGVCLGLLCALKPFFGLYALWYLARRDWRTLATLVGSAALALVVGVLLAGTADARQWVLNLSTVSWTWHVFNASVFGVAARLFTQQQVAIATSWTPLATSAIAASLAGWCGVVAVLALLVVRLRQADHDTSFALLGLAALLVSPLGWTYYLPTLFAPILAVLSNRQMPRWSALVATCAFMPYAATVNRHYGVVGTLGVGSLSCVSVLGLFLLVSVVRPRTGAHEIA